MQALETCAPAAPKARQAGDSFYLEPQAWNEPYILRGEEAHHLVRVLRAAPGRIIRLFDGQGSSGEFEILKAGKKEVELKEISRLVQPKPASQVWLALGWNKASRRGWLMEKAVELHCAGLAFWRARRGQGALPDEPKPSWKAQMLAGAKQCGNPYLPKLKLLPEGAAGIIAFASGFARRYILLETREGLGLLTPDELGQPGLSLCVLGPEGGFDPGEIEMFVSAGFVPKSLGASVLRWETAALLTLGLAYHAAQRSPA